MSVLVKTVHAAKAEKKDPKVEVKRRLLNYRNTPHPATGKAPVELVFKRSIKTRIPRKTILLGEEEIEEAKEVDKRSRLERKEQFDKRKRTVDKAVCSGDTVLIKQSKSSVKPPFDPTPYEVEEV